MNSTEIVSLILQILPLCLLIAILPHTSTISKKDACLAQTAVYPAKVATNVLNVDQNITISCRSLDALKFVVMGNVFL